MRLECLADSTLLVALSCAVRWLESRKNLHRTCNRYALTSDLSDTRACPVLIVRFKS